MLAALRSVVLVLVAIAVVVVVLVLVVAVAGAIVGARSGILHGGVA